MDFDKAKEVIMNSGYEFMEANNCLMAIIKSGMFDTDFIVFVDFVDDYCNGTGAMQVKYKCVRTNNIFSNYPYTTSDSDLKYFLNNYKDFVDSLKALDRIYSTVLEEFVNPDANKE